MAARPRTGRDRLEPRPGGAGPGASAPEAAGALLKLGFEDLGFHRIDAKLDELNTASASPCLNALACGWSRRQVDKWHYKGSWATELVYASPRGGMAGPHGGRARSLSRAASGPPSWSCTPWRSDESGRNESAISGRIRPTAVRSVGVRVPFFAGRGNECSPSHQVGTTRFLVEVWLLLYSAKHQRTSVANICPDAVEKPDEEICASTGRRPGP